jgi:hypothetical protein
MICEIRPEDNNINMLRVSLHQAYTQLQGTPALTRVAARSMAFWDLSKSRHKNDAELLKEITRSQSPINIKPAEAEYDGDLSLSVDYKPVHVEPYKGENTGHVILDGTKLGSITFQRQGGPAVKYNSTEIHFNGPSEHKQDGHRLDMEMQIVHHLEKG